MAQPIKTFQSVQNTQASQGVYKVFEVPFKLEALTSAEVILPFPKEYTDSLKTRQPFMHYLLTCPDKLFKLNHQLTVLAPSQATLLVENSADVARDLHVRYYLL